MVVDVDGVRIVRHFAAGDFVESQRQRLLVGRARDLDRRLQLDGAVASLMSCARLEASAHSRKRSLSVSFNRTSIFGSIMLICVLTSYFLGLFVDVAR